MDDSQRLKLQEMIKANNVEETTEKIRTLKHSIKIRDDVASFLLLKKKYSRLAKSNRDQYKQIICKQCSFLFSNYTNLFTRLIADELDLKILQLLLDVLKKIEDGKIDQHEGSYEVGKILKEMYIDSTLRRETKRDKKKKKKMKKKMKNITWEQFKSLGKIEIKQS